MQMGPFTPRTAAKFVVFATIQLKTAALTKDVIADHSRFDNDDIVVEIGGNLVGWYVAEKCKPYTDKMVDRVADKIVERRAARAVQQDATTE